MLGFGRTAVPSRPTLQPSDQIVVQISYMQVSSHRATPLRALISMISNSAARVKAAILNFSDILTPYSGSIPFLLLSRQNSH
jgi:hypothetical protein